MAEALPQTDLVVDPDVLGEQDAQNEIAEDIAAELGEGVDDDEEDDDPAC